jgi:nicotinamidase-related amidase
MKNSILVIIDLQNDFTLPNGKMPACIAEVDAIFEPINALIEHWHANALPVAVLSTQWGSWLMRLLTRNSVAAGSEGAKLDARLVLGAAKCLVKPGKSAFTSPQFTELLVATGKKDLVLCGLAAEHCITATAQEALERDLQVSIIKDAIASYKCGGKEATLSKLQTQGALTTHARTWLHAHV